MPLTRLKDEYLEQDCVRFLMETRPVRRVRSDHGLHL